MAVSIICFFQPGCMGCMEQSPINREVSQALQVTIDEIDAVKAPEYIKKYSLKVTPTIVIEKDGIQKERFEGMVQREQLEGAIKKYL
ncbi:MAG: thioredoxin family protein [Methanoregula sp.]|nr:MAG: thioredoxin family protein [Methanoregula sp.]